MFNFHSNRECNNLLTSRDSALFFYGTCTISRVERLSTLNQAKCKCNKNATSAKAKCHAIFLIALIFVRFFFSFFFFCYRNWYKSYWVRWGTFCIILSDGQWQESRLWSYNIKKKKKKAYNVNVVLNVVERKYWIDANKNLCTIFYIVMQNNFYDILYKRKNTFLLM